MLVYMLVAVKLAQSATPEALAGDQFIVTEISLWGPAIYIGLAAAALSSALGSILVAPRTLQALARDNVLPVPRLNRLLVQGSGTAGEPVIATWVSSAIAFVVVGDVDSIAQILSMFFMLTYGALCTVSFLEYFAGNPSYRAHLPLPLVPVAAGRGDVRGDDDSARTPSTRSLRPASWWQSTLDSAALAGGSTT